MRSFVGLESQRGWRDLRLLPPEAGRWVSDAELGDAPEPAVVCGLWAENAGAAEVIQRRQSAGLVTVLVPRFRPMNLQALLGASVRVGLVAAESDEVAWRSGENFAVPATTAIETSLPTGAWGRSGDRLVVFGWQPHTQAGVTVVCTSTVAARALGAQPAVQLGLLERIIDAASSAVPEAEEPAAEPGELQVENPAAYLERHGDLGALALLAWLGSPGPTLDEAELRRLHVELDAETLQRLDTELPPPDPTAVMDALRAFGWGAHLRIRAARAEDS